LAWVLSLRVPELSGLLFESAALAFDVGVEAAEAAETAESVDICNPEAGRLRREEFGDTGEEEVGEFETDRGIRFLDETG